MASVSFSLGGGTKATRSSPPPPSNGVKRTYASLDDAESDDDDASAGKRQNITHFDITAGGAVDVSRPKVVKQQLVIKTQANRDWKQASERKRQKYGLPPRDQKVDEKDLKPKGPPPIFGLDVRKSDKDDDGALVQASQGNSHEEETTEKAMSFVVKTDDERAIEALTGVKQESTMTIPAVTEEEAFERDYKDAPDAPTLEEYAAVPVEEFGAAMLRGMGWKEGQGIGTQKGSKQEKAKMPERRPALLGIGAKADAAVAGEIGAWGQGAKGKKRVDIVYNPLVLRNAKTGEQLTEDELKAKLQEQKEQEAKQRYVEESKDRYERKEKASRSSRYEDDDRYDARDRRERKERRTERDRDNDRRGEKPRSRRDRSASYEKERSTRHRSDSYEREKEEKRRAREYDDRREKDRRVSSRDDNQKDRDRRERHRDDYERDHSRRDRYDDDRDRDSRRHRR